MSLIRSRPLGSEDPPDEVLVTTPVFRYGIAKSAVPSRTDARVRIEAEGGGPVLADLPLHQGKAIGGFHVLDVPRTVPGARYDGFLVLGGDRVPLFLGAELYRLAIDDPSCRALPGCAPPAAT